MPPASGQWPSVKESSYSDKKSPCSGLRAGAGAVFGGRRFRRVIYSSISISASWICASGRAARAACSGMFRRGCAPDPRPGSWTAAAAHPSRRRATRVRPRLRRGRWTGGRAGRVSPRNSNFCPSRALWSSPELRRKISGRSIPSVAKIANSFAARMFSREKLRLRRVPARFR